jgi:3-deoxy-D-manno-octulosonic-acid transferase
MLQAYRYLTYFLYPLLIILIYLRSIFNKEDKIRFKEKIFSSHFNAYNNNNKLIWFHAASIGECLSIIPLIEEINNNNNNNKINFLITTVTLSSSRLLESKLNQHHNTVHRFLPLDLENLAEKFLDLWKPDVVCFVDSEIWPNFLFKIKEKKIPLLLINARLTKKSFNKWKVVLNFAKKVFNNFDLCLAASEESKKNLSKFEVKNLKYIGNLKYSIQNKLDKIQEPNKKKLNNYNTWCAASTHVGEELIVLKAHIEIKKKYDNCLTIIVPRHINRSSRIKNLSKKLNLNSQILNDNDIIKSKKNVSGQNPIEAAKFGCKIFHGPYVYNFQEIYGYLKSYGITEKVNNEIELAEKIIENFKNPIIKNHQQINLLNNYGEKILKETVLELKVYLK